MGVCSTSDETLRKYNCFVVRGRRPGRREDGVLARSAWTDDQHETSRPKQVGGWRRQGAHATRRPPIEGICATGAVRVQGVIFGVIPQVLPLWNSFALYLFETNVRSAMTLGIVRTGGIGLTSTKAFAPHYADTAAQVIVVVVAKFIIDLVSAHIRKRLI